MTFAYHRSLRPMLGLLLALGLAEALVIHLVAGAYWGWRVGAALGLVDIVVLGTLADLLLSFRRRPVLLDPDRLVMRTGRKMEIAVPIGDVAGLRESWSADDLKRRGVMNMALVAWPNVVVDLHRPVRRRRREITAMAHRLDDPAAFRAALAAATASAGRLTPPD